MHLADWQEMLADRLKVLDKGESVTEHSMRTAVLVLIQFLGSGNTRCSYPQ